MFFKKTSGKNEQQLFSLSESNRFSIKVDYILNFNQFKRAVIEESQIKRRFI